MTKLLAVAVLAVVLCGGGCGQSATDVDVAAPAGSRADSNCGADSTLRTRLFGAIETEVEWTAASMRCESMMRPNDAGVRLRFSGGVENDTLIIIVAVPELRPGSEKKELFSNVTVTVEDSGRFFSSPSIDRCFTVIEKEIGLDGGSDRYEVAGKLYCVTPLGEINGESAVSVPELEFRSIIDWSKK